MQAGWTEWNYQWNGSPITSEAARVQFGDEWHQHVDCEWTERITTAGRAALKEAEDTGVRDMTEEERSEMERITREIRAEARSALC